MNNFVPAIQGSYHQGNVRFGNSAGKQCSCMSLAAVCWSTLRKLSVWKESDLDFVLEYGNKVYENQNTDHSLHVDELPTQIYFETVSVDVKTVATLDGFIEKGQSSINFIDKDLLLSIFKCEWLYNLY